MIKYICDKCEAEITDKDFKFEGVFAEIQKKFGEDGDIKPELIQKQMHLCRKCYKDTINLWTI